jgi:hypothetical protein
MDVLKSEDNLTPFSLPKVHVIFSGECAIYTMRELDKATASILKTGELKAKFVGMQRRV